MMGGKISEKWRAAREGGTNYQMYTGSNCDVANFAVVLFRY